MTDEAVSREDGLAKGGRSSRAAIWSRWLEALNAFLERAFRTADIETGC